VHANTEPCHTVVSTSSPRSRKKSSDTTLPDAEPGTETATQSLPTPSQNTSPSNPSLPRSSRPVPVRNGRVNKTSRGRQVHTERALLQRERKALRVLEAAESYDYKDMAVVLMNNVTNAYRLFDDALHFMSERNGRPIEEVAAEIQAKRIQNGVDRTVDAEIVRCQEATKKSSQESSSNNTVVVVSDTPPTSTETSPRRHSARLCEDETCKQCLDQLEEALRAALSSLDEISASPPPPVTAAAAPVGRVRHSARDCEDSECQKSDSSVESLVESELPGAFQEAAPAAARRHSARHCRIEDCEHDDCVSLFASPSRHEFNRCYDEECEYSPCIERMAEGLWEKYEKTDNLKPPPAAL